MKPETPFTLMLNSASCLHSETKHFLLRFPTFLTKPSRMRCTCPESLAVIAALFCIMITTVWSGSVHNAETEDNEFAEFEDFDDDDDDVAVKVDVTSDQPVKQPVTDKKAAPETTDEVIVEVNKDEDDESDDDVEFEHFQDDEEFEGFEQGKPSGKGRPTEAADIKITKVPIHLRTNWDSFYLEMLMIAGLVVYFLNFVAGRTKNQKIANAWLSAHKQLLESNFHVVGDDGKTTEVENSGFIKESENNYTLWCSGRNYCEGMLVQLQLLKRQDLLHVVMHMFRPASDQIIIKVNMNPEDMDMFVFAVAKKKTAQKLSKEMADISTFCKDKKNITVNGNEFTVLNEISDLSYSFMDSKMDAILNMHGDLVEYIHISDQYTGPKIADESQASKAIEAKKVLIFAFNVPGRGHSNSEGMESMKLTLQLVFYFIDKVKRLKLGKDAKKRAEQTRNKMEGEFLKLTHQQRVEAAQARKEEKRRAEKERIMNEEDPEKQRKWEEKEHRRELKKRAPKMKQLKVKAL